MKNVPTPELKAVYNGKQRAIIKVSMNSIFGSSGVSIAISFLQISLSASKKRDVNILLFL